MDKFDDGKPLSPNRYGDSSEVPQNTVDRAFEPGIRSADGTFVFTKNPSIDDLAGIYDMLVKEIGPNVAPVEVLKSVYGHNPISFWGLYRSADESRRGARLVGFIAYLPLNAAGKAALEAKNLDGRAPDLSLLVRPGEDPEVLYLWAIVTPGLGNIGFALNARAIGPDLFERTPIVGWISTQSALDSVRRSSKTKEYADAEIGSTFAITFPEKYRTEMRAMPIIEGTRPQPRRTRPQLETLVVATPDQMAKVMAIRAAVFMTEQVCPYEEEFDGNDYAGAHILGLVDGQPAAVMRIRYFAEFVKLERLAVLPRFRRTLIAKQVVERGLEICRRKGYRKMYGQAQTRLVSFWRRFGFEPMDKNIKLVFSDHEYVEIAGDIAPHPDPLTRESDPLVLIRPEGKWDEPGVLDASAQRPPTNPH
jgi:predicted GNAT family N-acyltransferase